MIEPLGSDVWLPFCHPAFLACFTTFLYLCPPFYLLSIHCCFLFLFLFTTHSIFSILPSWAIFASWKGQVAPVRSVCLPINPMPKGCDLFKLNTPKRYLYWEGTRFETWLFAWKFSLSSSVTLAECCYSKASFNWPVLPLQSCQNRHSLLTTLSKICSCFIFIKFSTRAVV